MKIAICEPSNAAADSLYLQDLLQRSLEPGLVIRSAKLAAVLPKLGGAKGISVPDPLEPYQMSLEQIYIGVTSPDAKSEIPHWHPRQSEVYAVICGNAVLHCKRRWDDGGWVRRAAGPGDLLIVQPQVCHWFCWESPIGFAYVFKAPQIAGVGPDPAGKSTCLNGCPHFGKGCVLPQGFEPGIRKAA